MRSWQTGVVALALVIAGAAAGRLVSPAVAATWGNTAGPPTNQAEQTPGQQTSNAIASVSTWGVSGSLGNTTTAQPMYPASNPLYCAVTGKQGGFSLVTVTNYSTTATTAGVSKVTLCAPSTGCLGSQNMSVQA